MPEWLETDMAKAFTRAYRKSKVYMIEETAIDIARAMKPLFPETDLVALTRCIEAYQKLGCWTPNIEISRSGYEAMLDIYDYNGLITRRYPYEAVCAAPPAI